MDYKTNSSHQHLRDCIENSMENMHTDVRVERKCGWQLFLEVHATLEA